MRLDRPLGTSCIALLILAACTAPETSPPPPPPEVDVETTTQRDVTLFQNFTGNTRAIESVQLRARVQGFLESFHFEFEVTICSKSTACPSVCRMSAQTPITQKRK